MTSLHPCADCGLPVKGKRCRECYLAEHATVRPKQRCSWCGIPTTSTTRVCNGCKGIENIEEPTDDDALPPGAWMLVGSRYEYVPIVVEPETSDEPRTRTICGTERGYQRHRHQWRSAGIGTWPLPLDDPCGCRGAHRAHNAFLAWLQSAHKPTAPGLTCADCGSDLYPVLARRTEDGWRHADATECVRVLAGRRAAA